MVNRRSWLRTLGVTAIASVLVATPLRLLAALRDGFSATSLEDAMAALLDGGVAEESTEIKFKIPDIAENGAVVPVSVSTEIPGVTRISILIENNPNPLTCQFDISPDVLADVSTRVKMGKSSIVRVYAHTPSKIFTTSKEVKVTIGGCGG